MEILGYAFSAAALITSVISVFMTKMTLVLIFTFSCNFTVAAGYLVSGNKSGAVTCFIACAQVVINYLYQRRGKPVPVYIMIIHAAVFLTANALAFSVWYDAIVMVASLIFVLSVSQSEGRLFRFILNFNTALWIAYDIISGSYGNLVTHIVILLMTVVSMIVNDRKGKNTGVKIHDNSASAK